MSTYKKSITPFVSGSPQSQLLLNAGAVNLLMGFRATIAAGDDIIASQRLSEGNPNTFDVALTQALSRTLRTPTSRVDVVGLINGNAANNCINGRQGDTPANALAQMETFNFPEPVSVIVITILHDPTLRYAAINVEGYA